jgi:hypothetical protein
MGYTFPTVDVHLFDNLYNNPGSISRKRLGQ